MIKLQLRRKSKEGRKDSYILLICIITTAIVIVVTGLTVQFIINFKSSKLGNRKE